MAKFIIEKLRHAFTELSSIIDKPKQNINFKPEDPLMRQARANVISGLAEQGREDAQDTLGLEKSSYVDDIRNGINSYPPQPLQVYIKRSIRAMLVEESFEKRLKREYERLSNLEKVKQEAAARSERLSHEQEHMRTVVTGRLARKEQRRAEIETRTAINRLRRPAALVNG